MKTKKILSVALALIFAIGMLAGCAGGAGSAQKADISAFVDTDETLALTWLGYPGLAGCEEGKPTELLLEEKFNVEITPLFAEYSGYNDKKNAFLQAGDIPDLIYEMDPGYHFADARDEFLLEVPYAAIEKYAPSLYNQVTELAPAAWAYSYYEGKNYGMPNLNYSHMENTVSGYRGDWLEKVGMEAPKTLDELHDVLYAFVHNDPDGNGKDDTFGYVPPSSYYHFYFTEFFCAYGLLPFDWQEVDGKIVYGGLRQENEDVLKLLADWYEEGIIYPAFVELDQNQDALFRAGKVGYKGQIGYQDPTNPSSLLSAARQNFPEATVVYNNVVTGPEGKSGFRGWGYPAHTIGFGDVDENSPKKATRILKMLETMFTDDELMKELRLGKEGVTYTLAEKDTLAAYNYVATKDYADAAQKRLGGYEYNIAGATFWTPIAPSETFYQSMKSDAYKALESKFAEPNIMMTDAFYKVDIVPSAPTYLTDIHNAQQALMAKIIKSEIPADQYIEEFTKLWESLNGPKLLAEAEQQADIVAEIYEKVGVNK